MTFRLSAKNRVKMRPFSKTFFQHQTTAKQQNVCSSLTVRQIFKMCGRFFFKKKVVSVKMNRTESNSSSFKCTKYASESLENLINSDQPIMRDILSNGVRPFFRTGVIPIKNSSTKYILLK